MVKILDMYRDGVRVYTAAENFVFGGQKKKQDDSNKTGIFIRIVLKIST